MITVEKGDLLTCDADFICHQTNFYGVMGGGVAWSIKRLLLDEDNTDGAGYRAYQELCVNKGRDLLGSVQFLPVTHRDTGRAYILGNLFCQDGDVQPYGGLTSYTNMRKCLMAVERAAWETGNKTVAVPGKIGCGISGGNWDVVRTIIDDVFSASPVHCRVIFWDGGK